MSCTLGVDYIAMLLYTSKAEQERVSVMMADRESRSLRPLIDPDKSTSIANESSKQVRRCFKPRYRLRRVKNRGAILILIWSYCISPMIFYIKATMHREYTVT